MLRSIRFQSRNDTKKQLDLSNSAFHRDINNGLITQPVKFGARTSAFPTHEIDALIAARLNGWTDEQIKKLVADLHEKRKEFLHESMRSTTASTDEADAS